MTERTKAQRLADILQNKIPSIECLEISAAELRRLDANEAALLEALKRMDGWLKARNYAGLMPDEIALITRIEAERNEK